MIGWEIMINASRAGFVIPEATGDRRSGLTFAPLSLAEPSIGCAAAATSRRRQPEHRFSNDARVIKLIFAIEYR